MSRRNLHPVSYPGWGSSPHHHQGVVGHHGAPAAAGGGGQQQRQPQRGHPANIVPTNHDILSGRGVNIAQHSGNERFRALVNSRYDPNYCTTYTTSEKRAVATEIIAHIKALNPPGRFLKRIGRSNSRGLEGPWEELTDAQVLKKTCQALRDCNRQDRSGYASSVAVPEDVRQNQELRSKTGLTNKEHAAQAASAREREALHRQQQQHLKQQQQQQQHHHQQQQQQQHQPPQQPHLQRGQPKQDLEPPTEASSNLGKRVRLEPMPLSVSPSVEQGATWLKRQRTSLYPEAAILPSTTPTTVASSSGTLHDTSLLDSGPSSTASVTHHHHHLQQHHPHPNMNDPIVASHPGFCLEPDHSDNPMPLSPQAAPGASLPPSPQVPSSASLPLSPQAAPGTGSLPLTPEDGSTTNYHDSLASSFDPFVAHGAAGGVKAGSVADHLDPLHLAAAAIESAEHAYGVEASAQDLAAAGLGDHVDDVFPPPSPLHPDQHHHPGELSQVRYDD